MRNILLVLAYDGTQYHGFQRQANALTIQQLTEDALTKITKSPVKLTGCSRTDAGVHAAAYVCNFLTDARIPAEKVPYALNTYLPKDVSCIYGADTAPGFHARFSAKSKIYQYRIYNTPHPHPLFCRYAWHYPVRLDFAQMKKAAAYFPGERDFRAFMASGGQQKNMVKQLYSLELTRSGPLYTMTVHANSYLYNMVRIIAGTLAYVGNGKIVAEDLPAIIASGDRTRAGITAPPEGLCLQKVFYDSDLCSFELETGL